MTCTEQEQLSGTSSSQQTNRSKSEQQQSQHIQERVKWQLSKVGMLTIAVNRLLSATLRYGQENKTFTLHAMFQNSLQWLSCSYSLLFTVRYSSNHNVKVIGPLAVNQPHQ